MASGPFFQVDASAMRRIVKRLDAPKAVLKAPFGGTRGLAAAKILRTGTKGVHRQFVDQTEYRKASAIPWEKTKAFGTRKAPRKTMLGSGTYRAAWMGGAGAITRITPNSVSLGVESYLHPQVKIHQGKRASVTVKPKEIVRKQLKGKMVKGRIVVRTTWDYKMRFFLGMTYGVWMTRDRVGKGFKIPRRRVSVSNEAKAAVTKMIRREVGSQFRAPKLTTSAIR